jgi:putative transcriptional regulator
VIDFNFENNDLPEPGSVLLSEPFLTDDFFSRSVIFLCDHHEDGSFGFVLNKFVDNRISDFISEFPDVTSKVSLGGPVDTSNLFYLHDLGDAIPNSIPTSRGLFIGGDFKALTRLLEANPDKAESVRFFIGYSGWDKGQLSKELGQKSWIVLNNVDKAQILNATDEDIWRQTMEELGGKFKVMSRFPLNPSDN